MAVSQITVTGMVLAAMPVGDYDKRLVILTKEHGKISAFAKGARRVNSALLACSQPFSFGEFTLYAGKNSFTIQHAEINNYFTELREDIEAVYYGCYFCEFAEYITRENNDETQVLKLLYQTLRALAKKTIPFELIRYIFELKVMSVSGYTPQVFECVHCKRMEGLHRFSVDLGGIVCDQCNTTGKVFKISESTVYTLQFIIATSIEKLYTFRVSDAVFMELKALTSEYIKIMVEHPFKSLKMLQSL